MNKSASLKLDFDHDFKGKYTLHLALSEALHKIETSLHEGKESGTVKVIRDQGSYEADWELEKDEGGNDGN